MDDISYFIAREQEERELAERATDERARESHLALATSYAEILTLMRGENDTPWSGKTT